MELTKYKSKEELVAAYRKMKQRKREWQEQCRKDYEELLSSVNDKKTCC